MATPSTRLEAVNIMLSAIAQTPVPSLGSGVNALADMAETILDEAERDVLSQSWYFNTEYKVSFPIDSDSFIQLGDNIFHADSEDPTVHYTKRGQRLYNLTDHTYEFTGAVELTVVYGLGWEEMPETARSYVTAKAGRMIAERYDRDTSIIRSESRNEAEALLRLTKEDAEMADANPLVDDPAMFRANNFGGRSAIEWGL